MTCEKGLPANRGIITEQIASDERGSLYLPALFAIQRVLNTSCIDVQTKTLVEANSLFDLNSSSYQGDIMAHTITPRTSLTFIK